MKDNLEIKEQTRFHLRDGLFFIATDGGTITIHQDNVIDVIIEKSEWASIISSMSRRKGGDRSYYDALLFIDHPTDEEVNTQKVISNNFPLLANQTMLIEQSLEQTELVRLLIKNYNFKIQKLEELQKEIWSLWESMAECGELRIGTKFSKQYDRLKNNMKELKGDELKQL